MCINKRVGFERHRDGILKRRVPSVVLGLTVLLALVAPPFILGAQAQMDGDIRLVDPEGGKFRGRVEIFHAGQWGTVCDDNFSTNEARVVCNQLGYGGTPIARTDNEFGPGTDPIWLDDVNCQGDEASLAACDHLDWGIHNCRHHEDVGVTCNLAPTFDHGSSVSFQMAATAGPNVAVGEPLSATDQNLDSPLTYSLGGTDAASFTFDIANRQIRTAPDRVSKSSYELMLEVSDTHGGSNTIEVTITVDSTPTRVGLSVSPGSVSEDAGDTRVTVIGILDGAPLTTETEVTVSVGATGDTATGGADYATVTDLTLTIDSGQISGTATFTLTPADDSLGEGAEKISVTGTTSASGLSVAGTELTITDDDERSTRVKLTVDPTSVSEDAGATSVVVTGTVDGSAEQEAITVTVSVGDAGDTATQGTDYATVTDLTLTIDSGQTSGTATFTLTPTDDLLGEAAKRVSVMGRASGLSVIGTNLTITDNEMRSTRVELTVDPASVAEDAGATAVMVTGTLNRAPESEAIAMTVLVGDFDDTAKEGTDYARVFNFTLTIDAGQTSGTATFTLTPTDNERGGPVKSITVGGRFSSTRWTVIGTELNIIDDEPHVAEGAARLVGGMNAREGRVEVYVDGLWGTVCDDGFGIEEALVVCRQLGHSGAREVKGNAYFGRGTGPTNLDDVVCQGFETRLTDCHYVRMHNCRLNHGEDVGVVCSATGVDLTVNPTSVAEDAAGTLVTVTGTLSGGVRTEVTTMTVSVGAEIDPATEGTDYTAVNDRTLIIGAGQTSGTVTFTLTPTNDTLAEGDETISVTGTTAASDVSVAELTITDDERFSTQVELTVNPTSVAENAGETTFMVTGTLDGGARVEATEMLLRVGLDGASTAEEGTDYAAVETILLTIDAGETSATATFTLMPVDDAWDEVDETIFVWGIDLGLNFLNVIGTDLTILDDDESVAQEGALRLVGGTNALEGRVEVFLEGQWGTVCDDGFFFAEAHVACRQLGYSGAREVRREAYFGQGSGPINMDDVDCRGTEGRLILCDYRDSRMANCGHDEDVGVECVAGSAATGVDLTVDPTSVEENAGGTRVTVTGTLNGEALTDSTTVTVLVGATTDGATEGTDYAAVSDLTLMIDAGETSGTATFTLTPTDDTLAEGAETISVTGSTTVSGLSVRGTELTITDDELVSTEVELTVGPRSVAEDAGGTSVMVTGTVNGGVRPSETQVTVTVGAAGDEAVEGTDYAAVSDLTLTIDAGETSGTATFTLTPTDDTLAEGAETISVTGSTTVSGLSVRGTELTITDDELVSTEVELTAGPRSVAEDAGGTGVMVTGTLNGGARTTETQVTVTVGAAGDEAVEGTDYATVNDLTLTIDAGQSSGTATFTLTPTNDTLGEGDETISVTGSTTVSGLSVRGTELTITDDELVSTEVELTAGPRSVAEDAGGTSVLVTGTLNGGARTTDTQVTVTVGGAGDEAVEGTDYAVVADLTLTINAGQPSGTATFTLTPTDDMLGEGAETISVTGGTTVSGLSVSGTELTITDDELVSTEVELTASPRTVAENGGGTVVTVTGTLNGGARPTDTEVTVTVGGAGDEAVEGTDYAAVADLTLTIDAGQPSGTATFTLTPTDDTLGEGGEEVSVTGSTTVSDLSVRDTELAITDDDSASTEVELTVDPRSVAEDAGDTSVTVTGILDGAARTEATTITVSVGAAGDSATEGTDYAAVADLTLTIDAGQPTGTATFTLTPTNDTVGEGGEEVSVTGSTTVSGLSVSGTELTITDDELVSTEVELTASPRSVAENGGGTVVTVAGTLDGGARTEATTVTVTVGATGDSATEGTDYAAVADLTLTIDAGQPSGTATFTLTPTNDTVGEGGEEVSVTGSTPVSGLSVSGTELTILDDDSASTEVELTASPRAVAENGGGTVVTVTGTLDGGARTEATTVTVTVGATGDSATEGTDYAAVADLTLTIDAGQPSGTATFTLTPTNDTVGEGGEEVSVTGSTPVSGLSVRGTELTILDDDSASTEVELTANPRAVAENGGGTVVTVTGTLDGGARTGATTVTVSVGATGDSATEGTDYAAVADFTLTIDAGQPTGTATFTLTPTNDTVGEGGEEVSVTGSTPVSGLSVRGTELTILDDDSASTEVELTASPRAVAENGGGTVVTVTGTLDGAARTEATTVTVSVGATVDTATAGTDYAAVADFTLTIDAGQPTGTATFTLTPTDDTLGEGAETISVTGRTAVSGLDVMGTELTITDDDAGAAEVDLSNVGKTVTEKVLDAVTLSITGTLKGGPRESETSVTVSVGAAGDAATKGTDYVAVEDFVLTIPAGQTGGTASFKFTPLDDSIEEPDETVTVSGTVGRSGIVVAGTTVIINDDDERGVEVSPRSLTVLEGGASTYTVVLGSEPTGDVMVTTRVGGGSGGVTVSPPRLTFTSSNWNTPRTVTVTAAEDGGEVRATIAHEVSGADYGANGVLAGPVTVTVADGSGTGTISRAWLGRFGRTVADQVLDAVEGRMGAVRAAGTELSLAGQRIGKSAGPERTEERVVAARLERLGGWLRGEQEEGDGPMGWRPVTGRDVLRGSSFKVTGGSAEGGFGGVWGRGAVSSLEGREGELRLDGEVASALLGVDWSRGRGSAGVAVGHTRGEGGYQGPGGDGEVESVLTGVYPYGRYELSEGVSLWGVAGYGAGTFKLRPDGVAAGETDTELAMLAVGGRGVLVKPSGWGGLGLAMKPDVLVVRTTSEAGGGLVSSEAEVTRLRVGLEGTWRGMRLGGGSLAPGFEIGVRHDGGDAESGFGADVGAGFAWRDPVRGIEAELRARGLLTHEDGGFRERGFSGSLAWDPAPDSERGPSFTLIQTVGTSATGGMDALLRPETVVAFGAGNADGDDSGRRLEARFGYGFAVFGGRYTGTPELGLGLTERSRETSLGWRIAGARREALDFDVRLRASRLQPVNDERDPEHQIGITMTARW